MKHKQNITNRFWAKVNKDLSPVFYNGSRCWEWVGGHTSDGYGSFSIGQGVLAHRVSYEIRFGSIPNDMKVLHYCDNRACVNPDHLFLGTQLQNIEDMDMKGRRGTTPGEKNGMAKLTKEDVLEIRRRYKRYVKGSSTTSLAKEYGVTHTVISLIVRNKTWKE